ncbi:MAG: DUF58 domain-containing protein [Chloroflexi bacterium]|nr:DUF58 domain-containing protein [Chloroflexota bacterium]MYF22529.1 DUF58 domain-containing protein [Chloroflexota bacterium]
MRGLGAAFARPFRRAWRATFGTRRSLSIVVTLTIVAFAVGFASNYWLPQRLGYTLLFGLCLAALWTWSSGQGVRVRMSRSRDRVQAGESIIERFEVINDSMIPKLWLEVAEESDLPGHTAQFVTSLSRSSHRNWRVQTTCHRRGVYNLGPITVRSSDPFDIFSRELRFGHRRGLVVYPRALELPRYSAPPANLPGEGRFRRRTHYVTPNASGIRDYEAGDSVNRIHWKSSLRTGSLKVKTFELDPASHLWVVLDLSSQDHVGSGDDATIETAVTVAASVVRLFINQSRSVGLMMFGERLDVIEPDRGSQHFGRILESLAVAQPIGSVPVASILYQQSRRWGRHTTVIVVTASTDPRWQGAIRTLTQRGVKVAVALLDLESWGGRAGAAGTAAELRALGVQVNVVRQGEYIPAVMVGQIPGGPLMSGPAASADPAGGTGNGAATSQPAAQMALEDVAEVSRPEAIDGSESIDEQAAVQ